jgi:hypothetical protein
VVQLDQVSLQTCHSMIVCHCHCHAQATADPEALIGWAGWDHGQRAAVLIDLITARLDRSDLDLDRLVPLLAGLAEVLPWLAQWHPDTARDHGAFLSECIRRLGLTGPDLANWRPPKPQRGRPKKADINTST